MAVASCHHFEAYNFEVASKFLEYLYTRDVSHIYKQNLRLFHEFMNQILPPLSLEIYGKKYYYFFVISVIVFVINTVIIIIIMFCYCCHNHYYHHRTLFSEHK